MNWVSRSIFILFLTLHPVYALDLFVQQSDSVHTLQNSRIIKDQWLAKDKADHFVTSAFLTGIGYYAARQEIQFSPSASKNVAIGFSLSLGIAKEVYDGTSQRGIASWKDLVADMLGIGFGYLLITIGE
jgi:putative lipoprotein